MPYVVGLVIVDEEQLVLCCHHCLFEIIVALVFDSDVIVCYTVPLDKNGRALPHRMQMGVMHIASEWSARASIEVRLLIPKLDRHKVLQWGSELEGGGRRKRRRKCFVCRSMKANDKEAGLAIFHHEGDNHDGFHPGRVAANSSI